MKNSTIGGAVLLLKQKANKEGIFGILSKARNQRKQSDLIMIENAIKHVDFIKGLKKKLNEETLKELLTRLSYKHTEKGEYVYKKGDREDYYYIILEGKIGIQKVRRGETYLFKELCKGKTFGELSLSEAYEARNFSAIALEESHMATLDKESYLYITNTIRQEVMRQADALVFNSFFKTEWSRFDLMRIALNFTIHHYKRDTVIYREGETCEEIFFLRKGEVQSSKKIGDEVKELHEVLQKDFDRENQRKIRKVNISIWNDYAIFGDEEFYHTDILNSANFDGELKMKRKTTTIVNSDKAEIWTMEVKVFFDFLREKEFKFEDFKKLMEMRNFRREESFATSKYINQKRISSVPPKPLNEVQTPKEILFAGSNLLDISGCFPSIRPSLKLPIDRSNSPISKSKESPRHIFTDPTSPITKENMKNLTSFDYIQNQNRLISIKRNISERRQAARQRLGMPKPLFTKADENLSYSNLLNTYYPHKKPYHVKPGFNCSIKTPLRPTPVNSDSSTRIGTATSNNTSMNFRPIHSRERLYSCPDTEVFMTPSSRQLDIKPFRSEKMSQNILANSQDFLDSFGIGTRVNKSVDLRVIELPRPFFTDQTERSSPTNLLTDEDKSYVSEGYVSNFDKYLMNKSVRKNKWDLVNISGIKDCSIKINKPIINIQSKLRQTKVTCKDSIVNYHILNRSCEGPIHRIRY